MTSCFHITKRMGQNQRRRVCFVHFAKWRHRGWSVPSPTASCSSAKKIGRVVQPDHAAPAAASQCTHHFGCGPRMRSSSCCRLLSSRRSSSMRSCCSRNRDISTSYGDETNVVDGIPEIHRYHLISSIDRSTSRQSPPNKAGLKCPSVCTSVRPST